MSVCQKAGEVLGVHDPLLGFVCLPDVCWRLEKTDGISPAGARSGVKG